MPRYIRGQEGWILLLLVEEELIPVMVTNDHESGGKVRLGLCRRRNPSTKSRDVLVNRGVTWSPGEDVDPLQELFTSVLHFWLLGIVGGNEKDPPGDA